MLIYLILAAGTIALAMLVESKKNIVSEKGEKLLTLGKFKNAGILLGIFIFLVMVSACRIAIGNDYWEYTSIFSLIAQNRYVSTEFGFNTFVRICHFLFGKRKLYHYFRTDCGNDRIFLLEVTLRAERAFRIFVFLIYGFRNLLIRL